MEKCNVDVSICSGYYPKVDNCRCAPVLPAYAYCGITNLISRLKEYEDLGLEPDEIRQILKDGEELADAYIRYRNKVARMKEIDPRTFSVNDIEQWKEKADKYDELMVCSLDSTSELYRKAARYDKIVEALCDIFLHK